MSELGLPVAVHALQRQLEHAEQEAANWRAEADALAELAANSDAAASRLEGILDTLLANAETTRAGGSTWITIDIQLANDDPTLHALLYHAGPDPDGES